MEFFIQESLIEQFVSYLSHTSVIDFILILYLLLLYFCRRNIFFAEGIFCRVETSSRHETFLEAGNLPRADTERYEPNPPITFSLSPR